jgi:hypothetical protein
VRETYLNAEYAIYGSNELRDYNPRTEREELNLPLGNWHLLVLQREYGPYGVDELSVAWGDVRATRHILPQVIEATGKYKRKKALDGLFYVFSIFPTDPRKEIRGYRMELWAVALVPASHTWGSGEREIVRYGGGKPGLEYPGIITCRKRFEELTRMNIAGAVGMACSYPRQLLYGPSDLVALLLQAKRRHFIDPYSRESAMTEEIAAEMKKLPAERDQSVLFGVERTYARGSGVRLAATSGLFRNRASRLRRDAEYRERQDAERAEALENEEEHEPS